MGEPKFGESGEGGEFDDGLEFLVEFAEVGEIVGLELRESVEIQEEQGDEADRSEDSKYDEYNSQPEPSWCLFSFPLPILVKLCFVDVGQAFLELPGQRRAVPFLFPLKIRLIVNRLSKEAHFCDKFSIVDFNSRSFLFGDREHIVERLSSNFASPAEVELEVNCFSLVVESCRLQKISFALFGKFDHIDFPLKIGNIDCIYQNQVIILRGSVELVGHWIRVLRNAELLIGEKLLKNLLIELEGFGVG